ncbi:hypothetical protein [Pelagibaculum spongiae]|uniref:Peptidase M20 dimerisation domain-containing protein n=1 Tax=Pelagibaculum spongiae TaxID=2080658 RepID=A0A2V1GRG2_9GAMM|nr:hypothetical protein [Pelagibaculum spongiae]PVZ67591.1 hypothetical protein DC094_14220 [Pelagibaculum spongiae]
MHIEQGPILEDKKKSLAVVNSIFDLKMPAGMLFVPSINGRSHCFEEDTHHQDLIVSVEALTETCCHLLLK